MSYAQLHNNIIVLPTIEELVGFDASEQTKVTRIQTTGSVRRIPTAKAIVDCAAVPVPAIPVSRSQATVVTRRTARSLAWPVFLCGFIAGITGGIAVMKSPVGHKPGVQRVMQQAEATVHAVVHH